ncbi:MAG: DUF4381 domain-containing protein [Phyllobacterium sp.]
MEPTAPGPDAIIRMQMEQLADIVVPAPVSWAPQTWGWAVLATVILMSALIALLRWHHHRKVNRYRREALAKLAMLEQQLGDAATRPQSIAAIPELVKRVALGAWPRNEVASLSGNQWTEFLSRSGGKHSLPEPATRFLADLEYRSAASLAAMSEDDARAIVTSIRQWIGGHVVSA